MKTSINKAESLLDAPPHDLDRQALPLASIQAGEFQPLAPQSVQLEQRTGYILSGVALAIALAIGLPLMFAFASASRWVVPGTVGGWLCLAGLLFWSSHVWPKYVYRTTRWRLNDSGLEIQRGVWWKHRIAIPTTRVQHVDVSQGPLQRVFRLGTLTVHTAGTKNASIELAGLEHEQAILLRDELIEQKGTADVT